MGVLTGQPPLTSAYQPHGEGGTHIQPGLQQYKTDGATVPITPPVATNGSDVTVTRSTPHQKATAKSNWRINRDPGIYIFFFTEFLFSLYYNLTLT